MTGSIDSSLFEGRYSAEKKKIFSYCPSAVVAMLQNWENSGLTRLANLIDNFSFFSFIFSIQLSTNIFPLVVDYKTSKKSSFCWYPDTRKMSKKSEFSLSLFSTFKSYIFNSTFFTPPAKAPVSIDSFFSAGKFFEKIQYFFLRSELDTPEKLFFLLTKDLEFRTHKSPKLWAWIRPPGVYSIIL